VFILKPKFILISDIHYNNYNRDIFVKFFKSILQDIKRYKVLAIIDAGDAASIGQESYYDYLELLRIYIPYDIPVLRVMGNHDYWCKESEAKSLKELLKFHKKWHDDFAITMLDDAENPIDFTYYPNVVTKRAAVFGFNGWYDDPKPPTKDRELIPQKNAEETWRTLRSRATIKFNAILEKADYYINTEIQCKRILVTHFPPFMDNLLFKSFCADLNFYPEIKQRFDVLCVGHSHQFTNNLEDGLRILNCGSDYNNPKYLMFEV